MMTYKDFPLPVTLDLCQKIVRQSIESHDLVIYERTYCGLLSLYPSCSTHTKRERNVISSNFTLNHPKFFIDLFLMPGLSAEDRAPPAVGHGPP